MAHLDQALQINTVTGRYVLGDQPRIPGVNIFACRLRSISPTGFVAAAPVVGEPGDSVSVSFAPFGSFRGRVARHAADGFAVTFDHDDASADALSQRIAAFRNRPWTGVADKRAERRFLPGEPRSVLRLPDGRVLPCLVVDYSASGAAISADMTPALGTSMTVGEVDGRVVRLFDVGFAVHFDTLQDREEIEAYLEAPEAWREALGLAISARIDTGEDEDIALAGAAY